MPEALATPYDDAPGQSPGKVTLADTVYDRMRWDIVRGVLKPGAPLRMEALKDRYAAGFSPLREALNRLQGERLVVAQSLRGFIVAPLSKGEMEDAIETRILIESDALRRSIDRGGDAWEAEILAAHHELTKQARRIPETDADTRDTALVELERRHRRLHHALIAACGSPRLLALAETLYMETERYRVTALTQAAETGVRNVQEEHRTLVDAVLARDADAAVALLAKHFRDTGRQVAV